MENLNKYNKDDGLKFETPSVTFKGEGLSEEDIKKLNIPPRNEKDYPMPTKEQMEEAGGFMFKLNLMASSLDENLQAIVWNLYIKMDDFLHKDLEGASIRLAMALEQLKEYLATSNNPVLVDKKDEGQP